MDNTDRNDRAMHARGSCDMCKYCGLVAGIDKTVTFVCRRYPPRVTAALVVGPQGPAWQGMTSWPNVSKSDYCGEYEPQLH